MNQEKAAALTKKIEAEYQNVTGIVLMKDGKTEYEQYFNGCTNASKIHVYSVSKSVISILIGIALDKGFIKSLDQKVLDFFPDYKVKKRETTIQKITLRDLVTMTAPYKYKDSFFSYTRYFSGKDWLTFTLNQLGGKGTIGDFRYTPIIGPDILTGIIAKATGQSVIDFANENLFKPLGITVEKNVIFHSMKEQMAFNKATNINGWVADPKGLNTGGWGLTLSSQDMAEIGQLCLDKGVWNGQQIVSEQWMETCMKEHSRWEEQGLSYGYLWWLFNPEECACGAMGDGGNVIYFNRKKGIVITITSLLMKNPKNAKDRVELIRDYIEPLMKE